MCAVLFARLWTVLLLIGSIVAETHAGQERAFDAELDFLGAGKFQAADSLDVAAEDSADARRCLDGLAWEVSTFVLDGLVQQGAMFTDFHGASAVCSPSRASMLTGQLQQESES